MLELEKRLLQHVLRVAQVGTVNGDLRRQDAVVQRRHKHLDVVLPDHTDAVE